MLISNLPSDYANLTTGFVKVFEVICKSLVVSQIGRDTITIQDRKKMFCFWGGGEAIIGGFNNRFHRCRHQPLSKIHILSSQLVNDRRSRTVSKTCVQDSSNMANK